MQRRLSIQFGMAFAACLLAPGASATPITFAFSGTIDSVGFYDPNVLGDPLGTTFTGLYTFDSLAPDLVAGSGSGSYEGSSLSLTLVGQPLAFGGVSIGVNDFAGLDQYLVGFFDPLTSLSIRLEDLQGTVFSSDTLPLTAPPLASFESRFFFFQLQDAGFNLIVDVNGTITSLECTAGCGTEPPGASVPEPATLSLMAFGLCALAARRCRGRAS